MHMGSNQNKVQNPSASNLEGFPLAFKADTQKSHKIFFYIIVIFSFYKGFKKIQWHSWTKTCPIRRQRRYDAMLFRFIKEYC